MAEDGDFMTHCGVLESDMGLESSSNTFLIHVVHIRKSPLVTPVGEGLGAVALTPSWTTLAHEGATMKRGDSQVACGRSQPACWACPLPLV